MDIKDERFSGKKSFEELIPGDVFEFENQFFMKTFVLGVNPNLYNAVNIESGTTESFDSEVYITPLVVQMRILRNE